jgi:hypothetical protein
MASVSAKNTDPTTSRAIEKLSKTLLLLGVGAFGTLYCVSIVLWRREEKEVMGEGR